jgi:NAD-dependent dihydropyrimidine dehydrogenase PreA subunit/DNA-binding Lrp family transcriptional regulator
MAEKHGYERFIEHHDKWFFGLPESDVLIPFLQARLTPEEADFLADVPFMPHTIDQLAEKLDTPPEELMARLDPLAERGIVFKVEVKGALRYYLNDSLFILLRSPYWAGKEDEETKTLASFSNKYFLDGFGEKFGRYEYRGLRAIPVETTIKDTREIRPFEDVVKVIEGEEVFCTSTCPCRHRKNLDNEHHNCTHLMRNCLHFGKLATYMIEQGMGEEITRDQAMQILRDSVEDGLVHGISNAVMGADTICNCCSCCCLFFESQKVLQLNGLQSSNYFVEIETETCVGCGLCVERCPADALELIDEVAVLKSKSLCLGCGVCVYKCPSDSMGLIERGEEQPIPERMRDAAFMMLRQDGNEMPAR